MYVCMYVFVCVGSAARRVEVYIYIYIYNSNYIYINHPYIYHTPIRHPKLAVSDLCAALQSNTIQYSQIQLQPTRLNRRIDRRSDRRIANPHPLRPGH